MRILAPTIFLLSIFVVTACHESPYVRELSDFLSVPPEERLSVSIEKNDLRFLNVVNFTGDVIGVPNYEETYKEKYGTLIIPGTSDIWELDKEEQLNRGSWAYAEQ